MTEGGSSTHLTCVAVRRQLPGTALALAWSASGRRLAVALAGGRVTLRERSGAEAAALRTPAPVGAIAWRPPLCAPVACRPAHILLIGKGVSHANIMAHTQ